MFFQCNILTAAERKKYIFHYITNSSPFTLREYNFHNISTLSTYKYAKCLLFGRFLIYLFIYQIKKKKRGEGNAASCNMACEAELLSQLVSHFNFAGLDEKGSEFRQLLSVCSSDCQNDASVIQECDNSCYGFPDLVNQIFPCIINTSLD